MLSAIGSPLVAGSTAFPMATKHVEVLRPFYLSGQVKSVGDVIELEARFAAELIYANKAKAVVAPKPAPVEETVPEEVAPTPEPRRRSSKNVG